jgi:hypothetical protein
MFKTVLNFDHLKIRICFDFRYSDFGFEALIHHEALAPCHNNGTT